MQQLHVGADGAASCALVAAGVRDRPAGVQVAAAIEEYSRDEESEPAAIFLDIAAAFPSVEWAYMQWALRRVGVPDGVVDAIFCLYASALVHIVCDGVVSSRSLPVSRGIRQGCLASGTLGGLLCDLVVRRARQAFPRGDGLLGMRLLPCLVLDLGKTVVVNYTRRGHMNVKDVACDGLPCAVADVGKYMGVWLGPGSFRVRLGAMCGSFSLGFVTSSPWRCQPRRLQYRTTAWRRRYCVSLYAL